MRTTWLSAAAGLLVSTLALGGGEPPTSSAPSETKPGGQPAPASAPSPEPSGVDELIRQAAALRPMAQAGFVNLFLDPVEKLPRIKPRTLYVNKATRDWYTPRERDALGDTERAALTEVVRDETFYYTTRYGSPLAYSRPLSLLASNTGKTFGAYEGKSIIDYGYGTIGHLRLMAMNGAHCLGIDTDTSLAKLYSEPGDTGVIPRVRPFNPADALPPRDGSIRLFTGRFPVDEGVRPADLGLTQGAELFISKNTLKNGYIHPAQTVDKRMLVDLGTTEAEFLKAVHSVLRPGGYFMIYNICPAPAKPGEKYIPWADGTSPFSREQFEAAGFKVIRLDEKEDEGARAMARALGWDKDGMDIENDLFAWWTLVSRR